MPRESGLYYLQSRYYDPNTGRFLNTDVFTSTGQGLTGNNMFAYCLNNPVNRVDFNGELSITISAAAIVVLAACVVVASYLLSKIIVTTVSWLVDSVSSLNAHTHFVEESTDPPDVTYPGDDPQTAPEGTEWKGNGEQGSNKGNYHNPETGESWHPDLDHSEPIGPHWDYKDPNGHWWRVNPNGQITPKA